ncbi:hypothetical protein ACL02U_31460 [Streptomyces sp. MS06]|uniref:hypothetical protein n=1 Tax=Streptomyces sp. MS06 TaxID=3385974 RepID=UPI00399F9AE3
MGNAHLTYSGGANGEFTIKSVGCVVTGGKLTAITAPDVDDSKTSTPPAFTTNITGAGSLASLITPDSKSFVHTSASGVTGKKSGGKWIATVSGMKLGPTNANSDSIVVNGTITCGRVVSM